MIDYAEPEPEEMPEKEIEKIEVAMQEEEENKKKVRHFTRLLKKLNKGRKNKKFKNK